MKKQKKRSKDRKETQLLLKIILALSIAVVEMIRLVNKI